MCVCVYCAPKCQVTKLGVVEISEDGGVAVSPESTPLPPQHAPVVSYKGTVTCQTQTGDIASFVAAPYEYANAGSRSPSDVWERCASNQFEYVFGIIINFPSSLLWFYFRFSASSWNA